RDGYAVKYTSSDIIVPSGTESESLCSGLGIRCQRIIDPYKSTRSGEKVSSQQKRPALQRKAAAHQRKAAALQRKK
ncbi:MAG: hypothetical protein K2K32_08150, partial [Muribaculaceae bacterium]|nr:hypothetical protein [Muribaculaceae bacterium]